MRKHRLLRDHLRLQGEMPLQRNKDKKVRVGLSAPAPKHRRRRHSFSIKRTEVSGVIRALYTF